MVSPVVASSKNRRRPSPSPRRGTTISAAKLALLSIQRHKWTFVLFLVTVAVILIPSHQWNQLNNNNELQLLDSVKAGSSMTNVAASSSEDEEEDDDNPDDDDEEDEAEETQLVVDRVLDTPNEQDDDDEVEKDQEESGNGKPTFVMHVGIRKTGTSYMQTSLCNNYNVSEPILLQDNYVFLGTCPWELAKDLKSLPPQYLNHDPYSFFDVKFFDFFDVIEHHGNEEFGWRKDFNFSLQQDFVDRVHAVRNKGHNAVLIFESFTDLSNLQVKMLADFLNPDWNVKIMITYRPFFEWLLSIHTFLERGHYNEDWPGKNGGKHRTPFAIEDQNDNTTVSSRIFWDHYTHAEHLTHTCKNMFEPFFDDINVIGLHQIQRWENYNANSQLEYIFCHLMQGSMPATCQAVIDGTIGDGAGNESPQNNYDMLAVAAYETGLLNPQTQRTFAIDETARHQKEKGLKHENFPMTCPSGVALALLERMSWGMEAYLFPEADDKEEELHHEAFAKYVKKQKFCSIDVNKTLVDPDWIKFYRNFDKLTAARNTIRRRELLGGGDETSAHNSNRTNVQLTSGRIEVSGERQDSAVSEQRQQFPHSQQETWSASTNSETSSHSNQQSFNNGKNSTLAAIGRRHLRRL